MRVLFISNFYPPHDLGGWEQNCQEIVERFTARGHACHVLTSNHGVDGQPPVETGITRSLYLQSDIHYYRPLDFFRRRPAQDRANRQALRAVLEAFRPDIIFMWGLWNLSHRLAYWAEQWRPGRVAYAVAGYWFMLPNPHEAYWQQPARHAWVRPLVAPFRQLALRTLAEEKAAYPLKLEQVACVSEYVRNKLERADVLPHGARVIYNGIEPAPFLSAASQRTPDALVLRLVYTGGLVPHKGVHTAIEALGVLRKCNEADGILLEVVGSGHPGYETQLQTRVHELGLSGQVTFRGRVPRQAIPGVLACHDVFLFTSTYEEPIARTVMEAMATGLAVIGTAVGGQAEMLLDRVNALVYPPDGADALANCILTLRRDPALRASLARTGQDMVLKRFTMERMVDEMEEWLQELIIQ